MSTSSALAPHALIRTWSPEQEASGKQAQTRAGTSAKGEDRSAGTVAFEHLGKTYATSAGTVDALHDISLTIEAGSIFGIIGRSGAGKSSLLRTINLLEEPTAGKVLVDGVDIGTLNERELVSLRRRIGMIFQHFNLLSAKTVHENVALPLRVAGVPKKEIARRVPELLALVGLEHKHDAYPARLSGGQKQRVGIARALATRPEILLCDEATSALDPETTHSILQLLRNINRQLGITIVLITHEMSVIREIADRVLVLEKGRVAELGEVWQVFGDPQHEATKALLAPLQQGLPEDVQRRLLQQAQQPAGDTQLLLQLSYNGRDFLEPDFVRISQVLGTPDAPVQLLQGGIDRIAGHAHGRLWIAVPGNAALPAFSELTSGANAIAHHIEVIGHVHPV